ncbi:hypothetical protein BJY52DRAFT_1303158 [Lactarius psammicola]|nr:hypothetical protein BJY52DRAFT_1303158 [Lactarius psammicola]
MGGFGTALSTEPPLTIPWASKILRQFRMVTKNPSEANFRGPYNKLPYLLFPGDLPITGQGHICGI